MLRMPRKFTRTQAIDGPLCCFFRALFLIRLSAALGVSFSLCQSALGPRFVCGSNYDSGIYNDMALSINPHAQIVCMRCLADMTFVDGVLIAL